MEGVAALRLPLATMTIVNRCRMYLRVVYLADIVSGNGTSITDSAWKGKRDNTRNTPYDWPEQGTLSESCWAIWRDVLQKKWCAPTRRLRNTLGHWYESDPTTRFFYSPRLDCVIEKCHDHTYRYSFAGTGRRRRVSLYNNKQCTGDIPTDLQRTTVQRQPNDSLQLDNSGDSCCSQRRFFRAKPLHWSCSNDNSRHDSRPSHTSRMCNARTEIGAKLISE
jgi:hypothetical protein